MNKIQTTKNKQTPHKKQQQHR